MINDHLPNFYAKFGDDSKYDIIRSMVVNGHEVAWMSYSGTVKYDILQQGREGEPFVMYLMQCECDFIEGVGWYFTDAGGYMALSDAKKCLPRKAALYLRHLELRQEYVERFRTGSDSTSLLGFDAHFCEIVLDLIEKGEAHEWLEDGNGASFWGGHFYIHTVAEIMDCRMDHLYPLFDEMAKNGQIVMEGHVVRSYTPPPAPEWAEEPSVRIEVDGWVAGAFMPAHSRMTQQMKYQLLNPEGEEVIFRLSDQTLLHRPDFGLDVDDIATIDNDLKDFFRVARSSK